MAACFSRAARSLRSVARLSAFLVRSRFSAVFAKSIRSRTTLARSFSHATR